MNKLVILGAGWLGEPLAQHMMDSGWQVQATHRTQTPDEHARVFNVQDNELTHTIDLEDAYWVCAIAPGRKASADVYLQTLNKALVQAQSLNCKGFVLCSSTGVYANESGDYTEDSVIEPSNERQQKLYAAEQLVLANQGKVVRLGGLVGPQREPGRFVSGKTLSSHADDTVNMVHRDDVIAGISTLLAQYENSQDIYNLVNPEHPSKANYYQAHCARLGNEPPQFSATESVQRRIDGSAIERLGFSYRNAI